MYRDSGLGFRANLLEPQTLSSTPRLLCNPDHELLAPAAKAFATVAADFGIVPV